MMKEETLKNLEILKKKFDNERKPILFTGAGFTYGAKNGLKEEIPLGNTFKKKIITDILSLDIDSDEGKELYSLSLSKVCEYANNQSGHQLKRLIIDTFSHVTPLPHQKNIALYPWQKIYTINVDDLIERVMYEAKKESVLNILNSSEVLPKAAKSQIDYIKLHGCVNNPDGGFIFSSTEYHSKIANTYDTRYAQLVDDLRTETIVCIGAAGDEDDITHYLLRTGLHPGETYGNIFIINPNVGLFFKQKITKAGAHLIEMTGQEFGEWFKTNISLPSRNTHDNGYNRFTRNFINVSKIIQCYKTYNNTDTRFYFGDQPRWQDIIADYDFKTKTEQKIMNEINRLSCTTEQPIIISILSKAIGTKSVQLMRLGLMLVKAGFDVYSLNGNEFNSRDFVHFTSQTKNDQVALLVDDASGYYNGIAQIANEFPTNKRLVVITAARPYFHRKKYYDLKQFPSFTTYDLDEPLAQEDATYLANSAVSTLKAKGLLGQLKGLTNEEQVKYFLEKSDLTEALFDIFKGVGWKKRYRKAYFKILEISGKDQIGTLAKKLLLALAIFRNRELPYIPDQLLFLWLGEYRTQVENRLTDLIKRHHHNGITLRVNILTDGILSKSSEKEKMDCIKEILLCIAPSIGNNRHSLWNQIQARLMNSFFLKNELKIKPLKVKEIFNKLLSTYGDDANYFLQLGRIEQWSSHYELALNHFIQAEKIAPNLYTTHNSIARNFLKQSHDDSRIPLDEAIQLYHTGKKQMLALINEKEEYQVRAYSVHSLTVESVKYWDKRDITPTKEEVVEMFNCLKSSLEIFEDDPRILNGLKRFMNYLKRSKLTSFLPKLNLNDRAFIKASVLNKNEDLTEFDEEEYD